MTVRSSDSHAPSRSRLKKSATALVAALILLATGLPVVQAAPEDVVILTAGTATVNGAKDAEYVPVGSFKQNGTPSGATAATLFALYNTAGCSGSGELFLFIKMATPGLTVRTLDDPSALEFRYDANGTGPAETVVPFNAGPTYNAGRTAVEYSVCYTTVDAPAGQGVATSFLFSVSPAVGEGRVGLLSGAGSTTAVGIHFATPESGPPPVPSGTLVLPAQPIRLLDTRSNIGLSGKFQANVYRFLNVIGSTSIPDDAIAITGNVTSVGSNSAGFVSVLTEEAVGSPPISNVNFPKGVTRANNIVTPLAADGTVAIVYASGNSNAKTDIILDVTGYFLPETTNGRYVDLDPTRILDTRDGIGLSGKFSGGVPRTFDVRGTVVVPDDAIAVTGNLTVTGATASSFASLTTNPDSTPSTSTINFKKGENAANGVVIGLSSGGMLSGVIGAGKAHLVFDVTGYFTLDAGGAIYHQVSPTRLMDTRTDTGANGPVVMGTPITLTVAPNAGAGIPADAVGVAGNLTVTQQTNVGFVSATLLPDANPTTSTVNVVVGDNRANGLVAPLSGGEMSFTYRSGTIGATTQLLFDATGYFAPET